MLRAAIVGCGAVSRFHAAAYQNCKHVELAAVVDIIGERAKALGEQFGVPYYTRLSSVLNRDDIDIIDNCTPSGVHGRIAIAAAKAGKHTICEKPLEVTLQKCDRVIEAFKQSGTLLGGIFQHRFGPGVVETRKAAREGRLGKLTFGACYTPWWRTQEYYGSGAWRGTWKLDGGGCLMNQSIHMIDLMLVVMGPAKRVAARTALLAHKDIEVEDTAVAIVEFESGAMGVIQGSTSAYPGHAQRVEVAGDKGTIFLKNDQVDFWQIVDGDGAGSAKSKEATEGANVSGPSAMIYGTFFDNIDNFASAVAHGTPLEVSGEEAKKAVELICAIYLSAKKGKWVELPLKTFRP